MSSTSKSRLQGDGRYHADGLMDNGRTMYRVTIAFSDDFTERDDENPGDNPWHWDWAGITDQPDARVIAVSEYKNDGFGSLQAIGAEGLTIEAGEEAGP